VVAPAKATKQEPARCAQQALGLRIAVTNEAGGASQFALRLLQTRLAARVELSALPSDDMIAAGYRVRQVLAVLPYAIL
jgi:hypothetical protein